MARSLIPRVTVRLIGETERMISLVKEWVEMRQSVTVTIIVDGFIACSQVHKEKLQQFAERLVESFHSEEMVMVKMLFLILQYKMTLFEHLHFSSRRRETYALKKLRELVCVCSHHPKMMDEMLTYFRHGVCREAMYPAAEMERFDYGTVMCEGMFVEAGYVPNTAKIITDPETGFQYASKFEIEDQDASIEFLPVQTVKENITAIDLTVDPVLLEECDRVEVVAVVTVESPTFTKLESSQCESETIVHSGMAVEEVYLHLPIKGVKQLGREIDVPLIFKTDGHVLDCSANLCCQKMRKSEHRYALVTYEEMRFLSEMTNPDDVDALKKLTHKKGGGWPDQLARPFHYFLLIMNKRGKSIDAIQCKRKIVKISYASYYAGPSDLMDSDNSGQEEENPQLTLYDVLKDCCKHVHEVIRPNETGFSPWDYGLPGMIDEYPFDAEGTDSDYG